MITRSWKNNPHLAIFGSLLAALLAGLALGGVVSPPAYAQASVPITLTIWRVVEFQNLDDGEAGESGRGDYCATAGFFSAFGDFGVEFPCPHPLNPPVVEGEKPHGLFTNGNWTIEPFWTWTRSIPPQWDSPITIEILIKDIDAGGVDLLDVTAQSTPGRLPETVVITVDMDTGTWTGPGVTVTPSCSKSEGSTGGVYFDIRFGADTGDADGDGLLDNWELHGFDDDCDGTIDVDLPGVGARFDHKDLFLELDWMEGYRPSRDEILKVKEAFAAAPKDAGTKAGFLAHHPPAGKGIPGVSAQSNPDDQDGINLWVAAGENFDPSGSEGDLQPAGSCSDGDDNDDDLLIDDADPDCYVAFIDDIPGGNEIPVRTDVSGLTEHFYDIKADNFNPNRRLIFRYGLASAEPTNNTGTPFRVNPPDALIDFTKTWLVGEWISRTVTVEDATGMMIQTRTIISNTDKVLYIDQPWTETITEAWDYEISLTGGQGELGGNDLIVFGSVLSGFAQPLIEPPDGQSLMHELGHNLNLAHGGFEGHNCKPNYVSVMNYDYPFGIPQVGGGTILDFSPPRHAGGRGAAPLPTLDEERLNETTVLDSEDENNRFVFRQYYSFGHEGGPVVFPFGCMDGMDNNGNGLSDRDDPACYGKITSSLNEPVDWNGDGMTGTLLISANIDLPGNLNYLKPLKPASFFPDSCEGNIALEELAGFNDWLHISLPFRHFGERAEAANNPVIGPEPTLEERFQLQEMLNTADLGINKSASPDPVVAGEPLVYTLTVIHNGPNPASDVQVVDALPLSYLSDTAGCVESPPGTLTCGLGELLAGDTREFQIEVLVDEGAFFLVSGLAAITNTATVENLAGPDPDLSNNTASEVTTVIIPVEIDIKPGSDPNSINCKNQNGVIPVAILTADDFDAATVDHTTVIFEGAGEIHVNNKTGEPQRHEGDVDGDGDVDLVFHFRLGDTGLTCASTEGVLNGLTFNGQHIRGTDAIRMVGAGMMIGP